MVLLAPPDAGCGRRRVPRYRARQPRLRPVGPAAGARGGHMGGPRRRRARHPRCPIHPKGVCGGQRPRLAYDFALRHPDHTRGVVSLGIPFSPVPFSFETTMPEGFYIHRWREPGRAEADFGRYNVRRVVRTMYTLFSCSKVPVAKEGEEITEPRRPVHAAAAVVHRGGPRRLLRILREVRLPLPSPDTIQGSAPDDDARGRQVPGAGVHCDGGERLLPQVPRVRERPEERRHGHLRAGPQDHLRPRGLPLRAGAVPGPGQRPPPRFLQGPSVIHEPM